MNTQIAQQSQSSLAQGRISELYPISANRETSVLAATLVANRSTDADGFPLVDRLPTLAERDTLTRRGRELAAALMPGKSAAIGSAVADMLSGFSTFDDELTAKQRVAQYTTTVQHLPLWAVKRACGRFARGDVMAEEVGEKFLSRARAPSTAHLSIIAGKIVSHFREEQADIREALRAKQRRIAAPGEQERVAAGLRSLADRLRYDVDEDDRKRRAAAAQQQAKRDGEALLRDYAAAGIEPIRVAGSLVTLALARKLGLVPITPKHSEVA